jgi:hypothetical protein
LVWSNCGSRSPQCFSQIDARIIGWGERSQAQISTTMVGKLEREEEEEIAGEGKKLGHKKCGKKNLPVGASNGWGR